MKRDPRHIDSDKLVDVTWGVFRFRSFGSGFDDLARRAHIDSTVRCHVHLIVIAAPQMRQDVTIVFMGNFDFFPFAGFPFIVENVTPDWRAAIVAVIPLDVDRITRSADGVKYRGCWWNCKTIVIKLSFQIVRHFAPLSSCLQTRIDLGRPLLDGREF